MGPKIELGASILACDFCCLNDEIEKVKSQIDWIHVDIMDGHFVPNLSVGPAVTRNIRSKFPDLLLDCHLMCTDPAKWAQQLIEIKVNQITFHLEALPKMEDVEALCREIQQAKIRASICVNPGTPVDPIFPLIENGLVDNVLVMTVEPGFGGQFFKPRCLDKVRALRTAFPKLNIQVDGGITNRTCDQAAGSGANAFVAGTAIFGAANPAEAAAELRAQCRKATKF